jgi:WD40 repeat protein
VQVTTEAIPPPEAFSGHTGWVLAVAYSPDGTTLATTSDDGTIRIWNARTGQQVAGTRFGVVLRPMRPLAGIRSDQPSEQDLLGIEEDVGTLAALVAASATEPPLAIALLSERSHRPTTTRTGRPGRWPAPAG